ncbi:MAG: ABC transporter permease subunit [Bacilli bacterium]
MFSKALFKQSCKANGLMWLIITIMECFMLACVMCISGSGNIGSTKNTFENTIITGEIDSAIEKRSITYYAYATDGLKTFDEDFKNYYIQDVTDSTIYSAKVDAWLGAKPVLTDYSDQETYLAAISTWQNSFPTYEKESEKIYAYYYNEWLKAAPDSTKFTDQQTYLAAVNAWMAQKPQPSSTSATSAYSSAVTSLETHIEEEMLKVDSTYTKDSDEVKEVKGDVFYALNPMHNFDSFFTDNNEEIPADYDVTNIVLHISSNDVDTYLSSDERYNYISDRCSNSSSIFIAQNLTTESSINAIMDSLSEYGITRDLYDSFGYTYSNLKHTANLTIASYQAQYDYELTNINKNYADGKYATVDEYKEAISKANDEIITNLSSSLIASLPEEISNALEEVGKLDLYSLVVGTIFYKMAGLLLPIIYMIMVSNNLIAGQVDSGSMAYVLSTSTKRKTVTFTQASYSILSLLGMFICTTITSCICLANVHLTSSSLDYPRLLLMNLGAFLVLFALSGLNFLTSCTFDRSKRSMSIGGGLSMFALVATMLGLFGTDVIPQVIRLTALDYFNYASIITLFDVSSIVDMSTTFIWKFAILFAFGLVCYIAGSIIFKKKDLPL